MKKLLKRITLFITFLILTFSASFAQEKQKNPMELYIGNWSGKATIQNINMSGGWSSVGGFLGIHETTRDIWRVKFNVKFVHPLDDTLVIEEYKKAGLPQRRNSRIDKDNQTQIKI